MNDADWIQVIGRSYFKLRDEGVPVDVVGWLAYADWLEERGRTSRADLARWIATKQKRPFYCAAHRNPLVLSFDWLIEGSEPTPFFAHILPNELFARLRGGKPLLYYAGGQIRVREYLLVTEAYQDLLATTDAEHTKPPQGNVPAHYEKRH